MKCSSKVQAVRVAKAGAAKMNALTHTIKNSLLKANQGTIFTVVNNETGARYTVSIAEDKTFCGCPFFRENREFGVCKHILHVKDDWEQDAIRRAEEWTEQELGRFETCAL